MENNCNDRGSMNREIKCVFVKRSGWKTPAKFEHEKNMGEKDC